MIFKKWPDTRPKMGTHEPNVYPTILGGVSRGFRNPFLYSGARSAIFWQLKTGTFTKKTRFQVPKNRTMQHYVEQFKATWATHTIHIKQRQSGKTPFDSPVPKILQCLFSLHAGNVKFKLSQSSCLA